MLILVLLLTLSDRDPAFKERLFEALSFYRKNRDLLVSLASSPSGAEKSSPPPQGESLRILEEYLKKV